jgi:hypothetical protein
MTLYDWVGHIIDGPGGLLAYEEREWAEPTRSDRHAAATWTVECLANPQCEGSEKTLAAVLQRRRDDGRESVEAQLGLIFTAEEMERIRGEAPWLLEAGE